jgi:hypothetical protein
MSESIKAAREFLLENIPDQLDFALNPDTREMTHRMMTTYAQKVADEQTADLRNRLEAAIKLIEQFRQWDHLDNAADGPYWKRTIDQALKELQEATKDE